MRLFWYSLCGCERRSELSAVVWTMREDDLDRLRRGDEVVTRAITRLRNLRPVRRSTRLRGTRLNYRE